MVQNTIVRNKEISMKAKGLYLIIQSYITMPDGEWKKSFFENQVCEGRDSFNSAWKELCDAGYLKAYVIHEGKGTTREYELLEEPDNGPAVIHISSKSAENKGSHQHTENPLVDKNGTDNQHTENQVVDNQDVENQVVDNPHAINNTKQNNTNNYNINNSNNSLNTNEREREELNSAVHLSGNFCLGEEIENRLAEQFEVNTEIPVDLAFDTEEMTKVIMYLSDWNECIANQDALFCESYRLVVENLIELATMLDAQTIKGRSLSYNSVIYILNDIMKCDIADDERKLKFFVTRTVEKYMDILKHKTVGNQKKYIRSVIVDNFGTYRMEWEASIQKSSYDFSKPKKKVDDFSWLED